MCIAIYKPADCELSRDTLHTCWQNNSDGAGYMFSWNDELVIRKGFFDFDEFYSMYCLDTEANPDSNFVVHFRISTSGKVDKRNTHPHRVNSKLGLVHNGVLSIKVPAGSKISDTILFSKKVSSFPDFWYKNPNLVFFIREFLGSGNKIVLMNNKGNVKIINEERGEWSQGCWFSNSSHCTYRYGNYGCTTGFHGWYTQKGDEDDTIVVKRSFSKLKSQNPPGWPYPSVEDSQKVALEWKITTVGGVDTTDGCIYDETGVYVPISGFHVSGATKDNFYYLRIRYDDPMYLNKTASPEDYLSFSDLVISFPISEIKDKGVCTSCKALRSSQYIDEDTQLCIDCFLKGEEE